MLKAPRFNIPVLAAAQIDGAGGLVIPLEVEEQDLGEDAAIYLPGSTN